MDEKETKIVWDFLNGLFMKPETYTTMSGHDLVVCEVIEEYVRSRFKKMKYILGLAIDFVALAQGVANLDENYKPLVDGEAVDKIKERYPFVTERGEKKANTLTLKVGNQYVGIRKTEELVAHAFHAMKRTNYPSAYVYNTGQWAKFNELLVLAFSLSENGRWNTITRLFQFGLDNMEVNRFFMRSGKRLRLAEKFLSDYPRVSKKENGGLAFQAIVFGFVLAEYPHLMIIADKVRTGSARQKRFGDIDLYSGLDLELAVEVKDLDLTEINYLAQIGTFLEHAEEHGTNAMVFCRSVELKVKMGLKPQQAIVSETDMFDRVSLWDWEKQDRMVRGMLHFLARIEQNPDAVTRAMAFIKEADSVYANRLGYEDPGELFCGLK